MKLSWLEEWAGATEDFLFESGTDILAVCETFLDENSENKINISDFQFFLVSRNKKTKQSGLAILVKNYIPA